MTPNDLKQLARIVTVMGEAYHQKITDVTIHAYTIGLDDIPIAAIDSAVRRALKEKKFMPTVAELRELAGEMTPADRAVVAWGFAKDANAVHGYYGSVDFDDKAINATIHSMGGWEKFAERLESEGEVWMRKDFDRLYRAFARKGVTPREAAPLGGYHNRMNSANRFADHVPKVAMITTGLKPTLILAGPKPQEQKQIAANVSEAIEAVGKMPEESRSDE